MRKNLWAALLALALLAAAGCGNDQREAGEDSRTEQKEGTRVVTDALGRQVELPETVETFVALGNTPRMISYLGLAEKAAGVGGMEADRITPLTVYAYVNRELWQDLPRVGTDAAGNTDYYPEAILSARPDVILCTYTEDMAEDLEEKTGLPVVAVGQGTVFEEDYEQSLRILGEVCGVSERAEEVIAYIRDSLADLHERIEEIPEKEKPSVLSAAATFKGIHGIEGVNLKSPVLDALSADNAAAESAVGEAAAAEVDREQILSWDPDIIFCDYGGVALVRQAARENPEYYRQLQAFREGRIYQHPSSTSYFANLELSLANCYYIGSILYPETFSDIDPGEKANEIIEFFLGAEDYMTVLNEYGAGYGPVDFGE